MAVYLPSFPNRYTHPGLPRQERIEKAKYRKTKMDEAITFLANLQIPKAQVPKKPHRMPPCCKSVYYLAAYIVERVLQTFKKIICCVYCSSETSVKYKPIPQSSAETLENTTNQFERNTCGVCCIAPSVIVASPFIPATAAVAIFLGILSGLVITTTAGTNTYVFSGDIGIVPDGRGALIVQGGIRVDAITTIKNAFSQLGEHLLEKWQTESERIKAKIYEECSQIAQMEKWNAFFDSIVSCGVPVEAVEDALAPFSQALTTVLDNGEEIFKPSTPVLSPGAHIVIVDQANEGKVGTPLSTD